MSFSQAIQLLHLQGRRRRWGTGWRNSALNRQNKIAAMGTAGNLKPVFSHSPLSNSSGIWRRKGKVWVGTGRGPVRPPKGLQAEQAKVPGREGKEPDPPKRPTRTLTEQTPSTPGLMAHLGTVLIHRVVSCKGDRDKGKKLESSLLALEGVGECGVWTPTQREYC